MNYFNWNAMSKLHKYQYDTNILLRLKLGVRFYTVCRCEYSNFSQHYLKCLPHPYISFKAVAEVLLLSITRGWSWKEHGEMPPFKQEKQTINQSNIMQKIF